MPTSRESYEAAGISGGGMNRDLPGVAQGEALPVRAMPDAMLEERIALLYRHAPSGLASNIAASLVLSFLLWGRVPAAWLLLWQGAVLVQGLARGYCIHHYRRRKPGSRDAGRWGWRITWTYGLGGALWGIAGFVFFSDDPVVLMFLIMLLAGVVASSIGSLTAFYPAYLIFSVAAIAPFALRLALEGGAFNWGMCAITLVFLLLSLANGRTILKTLEEAIRLRLENQALAEALMRQKQIAEEASVAKSKFLAAASHDLRQPVHALHLFIDVLQHDLAGSPHARVVKNIKAASCGLEDLLNSLLDFSKIDAAAIRPVMSDFPIGTVLERLENEYAQKADVKGLRFRVMPCRLWVRSDQALLERMLRNLIENAILQTSGGGIAVGCRPRGGRLRLEVWDTGPGIPAHLHREIFREFYQLGNPERDRAKGLGLGLAIVDGLGRLLDHPVALASRPGKGSVFSIEVPLGVPVGAAAVEEAPVASSLAGTSVLVIDDDRLIRDAVKQLMERWGCVVLSADSAEQALSAMKESGRLPQLILADYRLRGETTGVDAIRQVQHAIGAALPAAIITGDTAPDRLREANASGYPLLHKPIDGAKLRTLLSYLMLQTVRAPSCAG